MQRTSTAATEVANAAQSFGLEDDISVIAVTRTAVLALLSYAPYRYFSKCRLKSAACLAAIGLSRR
jgi:hypothetical protein